MLILFLPLSGWLHPSSLPIHITLQRQKQQQEWITASTNHGNKEQQECTIYSLTCRVCSFWIIGKSKAQLVFADQKPPTCFGARKRWSRIYDPTQSRNRAVQSQLSNDSRIQERLDKMRDRSIALLGCSYPRDMDIKAVTVGARRRPKKGGKQGK